jgi:NADH:ubiquinone reductase (H+-translocating)
MEETKRVVIVGGGFGGVACALALAKQKNPLVKITLISDTPHFEYHGALYRLVTGGSPFEVCIPLWQIFEGLDVEICQDKILSIDTQKKIALGESEANYSYDYVVIGVGCKTCYYNTPGLEKYSFSMKSITEALVLKRHLHSIYDSCATTPEKEEQVQIPQ